MAKYAAFISYRHGDIDEKAAIQIHKEIERYRLPGKLAKKTNRSTVGKVFRDAEELKASSNLSESIKEAIRESEWLIVVCTRRYKDSVWCMEEVEYFISLRGREYVIVVLVDGEPQDSFPKILTEIEENGEIIHVEPLAVDVRGETDKQVVKKIKTEKFRILARMLDLDFDDLRQRQRERKRKQMTAAVSAVMLILGTVTAVVTGQNIRIGNAYRALDESMQQTLHGQSYYLSEYADEAYENGDRLTAALLALEGMPKNLKNPERPFVESVGRSLTTAIGIYDFSAGYQPNRVIALDGDVYDTGAQLSEDKKYAIIEKYMYAAGNMLRRKVYVYTLEDYKLCGSYDLTDISRANYSSATKSAHLMKDSRTLVYLGEDGLQAVNIESGELVFKEKAADEMLVSEDESMIAAIRHADGQLAIYNASGKALLQCDLGTDNRYALYDISPDSSALALLVRSGQGEEGILLLDCATGENSFIPQAGQCRNIFFQGNDRFCFIRHDSDVDLEHIVVYDIKGATDSYLCDTDGEIKQVCKTGRDTCLYYRGKKIYEVNVRSGKKKWTQSFSDDVLSVHINDGYMGVTTVNGSSYFYELDTKNFINTVPGNTEAFYMIAMDDTYALTRDYWGKNIRLYQRQSMSREDAESLELSGDIPDSPGQWFTASVRGDVCMLGYQKGNKRGVRLVNVSDMSLLGKASLKEIGCDDFSSLSLDMTGAGYMKLQDSRYGEYRHYQVEDFKELFSIDEGTYFFYNEDSSKVYVTEKNNIHVYDGKTGKSIAEQPVPDGYDRGCMIDGTGVFSSDRQILIRSGDQKKEIPDAQLYSINEERKLLFYRNENADRWFVYSLEKEKVICEGQAGTYSCTIFFGQNKYFLNDYNEVYDMDTWKRVLDLSDISSSVYDVQTSPESPYFVVWCQNGESAPGGGKVSGANVAYLYSREKPQEVVGIIPNFVCMTKDGRVVVFDGKHTLYKIPLYSIEDIVRKAKDYVGETQFTDEQIEKYHLYSAAE